MSRSDIFTAFRRERPEVFNEAPERIGILDGICDDFGIARDGEHRRINDAGRALIRDFESCELTAYRDPAGVWTIGWGHTGPDVVRGKMISQVEADALFDADLARFERAVERMAPVATDNQFAAMVTFAFNVGEGDDGFKTSTLRRKHNEGDYAGAQAQFGRWVFAKGEKLRGLERRRAAEAALYGKPS